MNSGDVLASIKTRDPRELRELLQRFNIYNNDMWKTPFLIEVNIINVIEDKIPDEEAEFRRALSAGEDINDGMIAT
jgi:hypothetical protein